MLQAGEIFEFLEFSSIIRRIVNRIIFALVPWSGMWWSSVNISKAYSFKTWLCFVSGVYENA